jgi:hypothetical protein
MNGLDEIRVAGEGLQRGRLVLPEKMGDIVLLHLQRGKLEPRERVFEVSPDPLYWVQLWTIGWQEYEAHVGREGEPLGGMGPAVIQEQEIEAVREGLGEGVQEDLEALCVEIRQLQEEPVARRRLHGAVNIPPLENMLDRANRLHAARGEASTADGQETEAAFVLTKDPDGLGVCRRDGLLKLGLTGTLEGRNRFRLFLCDWGAAL